MHRALRICEILLEIFAHVNTDRNPRSYQASPQKSLAALAATCKTFHEPAMNELWAVMFGLTPLLGCVTRLYPMIYQNGHEYSLFDFPSFEGIEPLSENEGRQFLRHAARVRFMYVQAREDYHRLLSVLKCTMTCMFPRLLSLRNLFPACSDIYLSPTLRRCNVRVTYPEMKVIATCCAALEHLSLKIDDENIANELSLLSDCVCLCKRLVTLSCSPLDLAAWKHLSNLPTLTEVAIDRKKIYPSSSDLAENHLDFGPFLNLTALSFTVHAAAYIIALMQHSDFPSLKQFKMRVDTLSWAEAEQVVRVLSQCKACQTLEQIEMHGYASDVQDPRRSYDLTHFCCFTQLRILRLAFPRCCIQLDNDLLLEIMSSWPHLRSLDLKDSYQTRGIITFRGLFAALRQCPHLHRLNLLIDAVNIDVDPMTESFRHTSLQEWNVQSAQVMDVEAVTRITFSMLPCVDTIYHKTMSTSRSPPYYAWPDVNRRLRSLHGVVNT